MTKPTKESKDTLLRQWTLMQILASARVGKTSRDLVSELEADFPSVSIRTVQRDLETISAVFPITREENSKPFKWYWMQDTRFEIPGITPHAALTFEMVEQHMVRLLPRTIIHNLAPYFSCAKNGLERIGNEQYQKWSKKIRVIPQDLPRYEPALDQDTLDAIYQALMEDKIIDVEYRRRNEDNSLSYQLYPVALVYRGTVGYLICFSAKKRKPRFFVLHRFQKVTVLNTPIPEDLSFDLDDYIATRGELGFPYSQEKVQLKILIYFEAAPDVIERPISSDQVVEPWDEEGNWLQLEAMVSDDFLLRRWLMGLANEVEVLEPQSLRDEFEEISAETASYYQEEDDC